MFNIFIQRNGSSTEIHSFVQKVTRPNTRFSHQRQKSWEPRSTWVISWTRGNFHGHAGKGAGWRWVFIWPQFNMLVTHCYTVLALWLRDWIFKYKLGVTRDTLHFGWAAMHCGCMWPFPCFRGHWQSPCTALTAGKLPAVSAVHGDCERVYRGPISHARDVAKSSSCPYAGVSQRKWLTICAGTHTGGANEKPPPVFILNNSSVANSNLKVSDP